METPAPAPTKQAKCVTCGKDITIGKFASAKTAQCEEHQTAKPPKPAKVATATETPTPSATPAAAAPNQQSSDGSKMEHGETTPTSMPDMPTTVAPEDPFAALAAGEADGGTATGSPVISPVPEASKVPDAPVAPVAPVAPASGNETKVLPEYRDVFRAIVGKPLVKEEAKAAAAGFKLSPHGVLFKQLSGDRLVCFIEQKQKTLGISVTRNGVTEPVFDEANLHKLVADELDVLLAYKTAFLG